VNGLLAVQARMSTLSELVSTRPATTAATTASWTGAASTAASTTGTAFASALAALGVDASSLTGTTGTSGTAPTSGTSGSRGGAVTGDDLVAAATRYVGTPYVWGGESLDEGGLDCSGLVQRSFADLGVTGIPRTAREQMTIGTAVPSLDQALPGDLVVLGGGSHIGIYVGDGRMVDAPKPGRAVTVRDIYATPTAIRRVLPAADGATQVSTTTTTTAMTSTAQAQALSQAQRTALELVAGLTGSPAGATSTRFAGVTS
jgi:cell wall-associated NlpC family hydrolase